MLTLTNRGQTPRSLSVYCTADFVLGNAALELHEGQFLALFNAVTQDNRTLLLRKNWWHTHSGWAEAMGVWPYRAFMTSSQTPTALTANRNDFIGAMRYYHNPSGLDRETVACESGTGKPLLGVLQWRITLAAGDSWSTDAAIALIPDTEARLDHPTVLAMQNADTYAKAWTDTRENWQRLFAPLDIQTPEPTINAMVNWWNKLQVMVNFYYGRGPSYYHQGQYPAMRDCCQDAFGVIPLDPRRAKNNLRRIAHFFTADGRAGAGCNRIGLDEGVSIKVDLPLWFVLVVMDYLRETADWEFLDERFPLIDGGESSVFDKMVAGIDRMIEQRGAHGLPLMGEGDWNDAANMIGAGGKGESVWLGQFLYFVINEIMPVLEERSDTDRINRYVARAEELKSIVSSHCWDGDWYVRAFRDDGSPVGVKGSEEGYIWINSQTWAAIAEIDTPERLARCMESVETHMGTRFGLMNLAPAYSKPDDTIGLITRFRSGWKENAAVLPMKLFA